MQSLKLLSNNVTLGATANNIFGARVARVTNANTTTAALITLFDVAAAQLGEVVCPPLGEIGILKLGTDTLKSNLTSLVFASAIGHSY